VFPKLWHTAYHELRWNTFASPIEQLLECAIMMVWAWEWAYCDIWIHNMWD